jgi:hypothetical protein
MNADTPLMNDMAKSTPLGPKGDKQGANQAPVPGTREEISQTILDMPADDENGVMSGQSPHFPSSNVLDMDHTPATTEGPDHLSRREIMGMFNFPALTAAVRQFLSLRKTWAGSAWNYAELGLVVLLVGTEVALGCLKMRIRHLKKDSLQNAQIIEKLHMWVDYLTCLGVVLPYVIAMF